MRSASSSSSGPSLFRVRLVPRRRHAGVLDGGAVFANLRLGQFLLPAIHVGFEIGDAFFDATEFIALRFTKSLAGAAQQLTLLVRLGWLSWLSWLSWRRSGVEASAFVSFLSVQRWNGRHCHDHQGLTTAQTRSNKKRSCETISTAPVNSLSASPPSHVGRSRSLVGSSSTRISAVALINRAI